MPPSEKLPAGEPPLPPPPLLLRLHARLAVPMMCSHFGTLVAGSHVQSAWAGVSDDADTNAG
jgi:hypothetical protein